MASYLGEPTLWAAAKPLPDTVPFPLVTRPLAINCALIPILHDSLWPEGQDLDQGLLRSYIILSCGYDCVKGGHC